MRLPPLLLLGLVAGLAAAAPLPPTATLPAGFVHTDGPRLLDGAGQPLRVRGVNLGNWLVPEGYMWHFQRAEAARAIHEVITQLVGDDAARAFWTQWQDRYITAADIRVLRAMGCNAVRVPLHHQLLLTADAAPRLEGPGWALLDRLIGWCKAEGLLVLLDLHAAPGGQTGTDIDDSAGHPFLFEDATSQERTVTLWRGLAARYRDEPTVLGYDLLNEPIAHFFDTERLNPRLAPLYRRLVAAIREVDPHHVILLGGAQWNTNFDAVGAPFAPNLVYTFHTYWTEPDERAIARYLALREQFQVPLLLGESGENQDEWIGRFRALLDAHDIGWFFWPYKKVTTVTGVATVHAPEGWDAIRAFADGPRGTMEEIRKSRPAPAEAARVLAALLENLAPERCQFNAGYIRALGLTPPPAPAAP